MRTLTKSVSVIFLAAASVYSSQVIVAAAESGAILAPADGVVTDVKLLEDDPFAATTAPSTQPTEGRSVSSSEVAVNEDSGTVEIHVNDASLIEVLRMLSMQTQKNILPSKEVRGTVTANLYEVTVREALDAILHANGFAYREKGNFIYVYSAKEMAELEQRERKMQTRVFRLYYTPAANVQNMVKPVLSEKGSMALTMPAMSGIKEGPDELGGNDHAVEDILVVTDYPENLDRAAQILAEIDRRPQQILLEAVILRAVLNEDNALGVDFNVLSGVNFTGFTTANGALQGPDLDDTAVPNNDNIAGAGTGNAFTNGIGGVRVGVISNNVSVFLSALEQITDTTILANPKILTLNKQKGEVHVGNEDGYFTTTTTETSTSQTVEQLITGTRLVFRPYIAGDGYIRMEVHPEDSSGEVRQNGLPSRSVTQVSSNVMVKDGHTIVIGGLFRESSSIGRNQVPFLGNIPILGRAFKSQRDRSIREEVIVLLTPHIVKDDLAYSELSEEQLATAEKVRVGMRRGMMPWGRSRLAECHYEAAEAELNKPRPNRWMARWHLDCALNLNPKFIEAIEAKQELTGKEITGADSSTIRDFVREAMARDLMTEPPATQPLHPTLTAEVPVAALDPTTQPAAEVAMDAAPATQPVAGVPTTQPLAEAPATQPGVTQSQESESAFGRVFGWFGSEDEASSDESSNSDVAEVTEVTDEAMPDDDTTITELPTDEVEP